MDDIYDDLTNYEDVNALEELRTENKELKEMLDKRSAAMEKLQKDYDTLEAEFKKLEHNYSSLLLTARAEIERKTQRINQLNTEKDMMVLNALKSGQRIRRNFSKGQTKYEAIPGKGNNNKNKENIVKQKKDEIKQERRETPVLPPKDTVPESGASNKNKSDNAGTKVEQSSTKKSNVNKNIAQPKTDLNEPPKASASSIKDRRKSMPAASMPIDTFSSDDEPERNYQTKDTRTEHIQSDNERRNTYKIPINKNNNKASEISSVDDRVHNYHDPVSRDNYKGRPSRQQDTSLHRSRDKYEDSLKNRKQYSPERGQKRHREHQDDYHRYERERYKGRSLESPPPESYSRYSRRKSEYRSDYDRYSHDYEKMRHHYDDKYSSSKYRTKDYDEPQAKRQRTELYSNPNAQSKEDKRHRYEREPVDGQPVPCFSPHEYDMLRYSCQSPDFVYTDAGHTNPIKEIMATATVPLEDPRATSKKYVIWKDNGNETLSTVVGRNIDIIPVNKAEWNVKPVDIPAALVRRPSQCSDQLVKDIYMDIDSPVPNLDFSIESGEVRETDEEIREIRSKPKEIKHDTHDFKISKQVTKDLPKQPIDVNVVPPTNIAGYGIPKVGQNKKYSYRDVPIIDLDDNLPHHKNANKKSATEDSFSRELLTRKQQYNEREKEHINEREKEHNKNLKSREAADNLQSQLTSHEQKYNEREERVNVEDSLYGSKNYGKKERVKNVKPRDVEKELSTRQYDEGDERKQVEDFRLNNKKYDQMEHTKKTRSRETEDSLRKEPSTEDLKERMHVKASIPNYKKYGKMESNKTSTSNEKEDSSQKELSTHKQQYDEREERVDVEDSVPNNKKYSKLESNKTSTSKEREDSSRKELSTHKQQYDEREERVNVKDSLPNNKRHSKLETNKTSTSKEREGSFRNELSTHKQQYDEREERVNVKDSLPNNEKYSKLESNKTSTSKEREDSSRKELSTHEQQYDEREERVNVKDSLPNNEKYSKLESNKTSISKEREDSSRKELSTHKQQYDEREERVNVKDSLPNNKKHSQLDSNKTSTSKEREDSFRKELSTHKQQYDEREERVNVKDSLPNNEKYSKLESNKTSISKEREDSSRKELLSHKQQSDERKEAMNVKDSLPNNKKHNQLDSNKTSTSKEREDSFRIELSTHKQQYDEREERVNVKNSLRNNEKQSKLETNKKPSSTETNANQNQSTLTKIAIVADDLELSDDNSDHMDANRTAPTKSHKTCEKPINMNEAKTNDSGNISDDKTLTSSHNTEIKRTVDTADITAGKEEEKCKESVSNKKQKSKRKKSKSISKDLVDSGADAIHVPEKKSRSKKEKESTPQETKEKFSDLFGDSSSLMTPEDLGIPSYLPISEDAQDAVDIRINQIIDGSPLNYKNEIPEDIETQNRVEIKIQETEAHDDIPKVVLQQSKTDAEEREVVTEIKKKSSKKNKENVIEPSQLPSPIVYENLNPGTDLNDPNVVKTVIISTGKQPEIAYDYSVEVTKSAASLEVNSVQGTKDHLFPAAKEYKTDVLKALATSTPHKEFSAVNALLPNASNTDAISDPCVSKAVASITGSEQVVNQTETNTESNDVPDVRIFVKRRRKAVKRPQMT